MYPYIYIVLPSYSVMALVGGFAALCLMFFRLDRYQIEFAAFLKMFFLCVVGGFIGSKVLFAATQLPWLFRNFSLLNLLLLIPQSGLVFYGGLFGVIFTLMWLTAKDPDLRERAFRLAVPAMPLFHVFGRVGCFLAGCCYGRELAGPLTVGPLELTRVPVQLMEALAELFLFALLMLLERKAPGADPLRVYLTLYALIRFCDEFLRGDTVRGIFFGLSTAQWISLMILAVYAAKLFLPPKKPSPA